MTTSPSPGVRPVLRAAVASLLLALAVAGCGDDDATGEVAADPITDEPATDDPATGTDVEGEAPTEVDGGPGPELTVIAEDIGFPEDRYSVEAGDVHVAYENQGTIVHTLVIDGVDDFELTVSSLGDVDEGTVELEAGEYDMFCDIPGHRIAGMEANLVVS